MGEPRDVVTVSISYHGCPDTVRRSVDAVLAQTHEDLVVVVTNDGDHRRPPWSALADITDPRLHRVDLPVNRGRYYADALALENTATRWFAVHDADDQAEATWLEEMLAAATTTGAAVVLTAQTVHSPSGRAWTERVLPWTDGGYRHHAHMAGLWDTGWLRAVGGPHPGYRVGWDTMLTGTALAMGAATILDRPLYTRYRRYGSLTTSAETGMRSPLRAAAAEDLRRVWPRMVAAAPHGTAAVAEALATSRVPRPALDTHVRQATTSVVAEDGLWSGWALDQKGARVLADYLADHRPRLVVEAGSGASTLLLAEYAATTGARVISLEHQPVYRERTLKLLADHGLADRVRVMLADLVDHPDGPWYDTDLPDGIELALVDGPPEGVGGRAAALPALLPHLAPDAVVLLDDAHRPGEQAALDMWEADLGARVQVLATGGKPMARITVPSTGLEVDASDVVLTLLTGGRPHLLADTLATVRHACPGLLESAHVIVLNTGRDPATMRLTSRHRDLLDDRRMQPNVSIGRGVSRLAEVAAATGRPWWLHLEDDWRALPGHPGWLDDARHILADHREVYQVRLRHQRERVLSRHMVTQQPMRWQDRDGWAYAPQAHLTLNPTLSRTRDIGAVWPAVGEREAQQRAHAAGLRGIAQLSPGVFVHTGADASLRAVTGCPT